MDEIKVLKQAIEELTAPITVLEIQVKDSVNQASRMRKGIVMDMLRMLYQSLYDNQMNVSQVAEHLHMIIEAIRGDEE